MPRAKQFDQQKALTKAMVLFWEKGYSATSLSDLTKHLEIGKGSFYDTFHGKRELFNNALALYRKSNIDRLQALLNSESDVKTGIRKLFNFTLEEALNDENRKGCFVANTCSELGGSDAEIRTLLIEHNKIVHKTISNYLLKETLPRGVDAQQLADVFITFLTGINQEIKFKDDKKRILESIEAILRLLE